MKVTAANVAWMSYAAVGARRWRRLTTRVERGQERSLERTLRANAATEFGREHGFDRIDSVAEFRRRVPVRRYGEIAPWIDRIAAGEPRVLTAEPVRRFGVTSGTTRASKLVPYTDSLLREFQAGIAPWAFHMFRRRPGLLRGTCYWSLTPVGARESHTAGGIPVGFDDDRRYLGRAERWIVDTAMPVPSEVARIEDIGRFRYLTLRHLLEHESLAWVSIWNPTFLTLLVEPLVDWHEQLVHELPNRERAKRLRAIFRRRDGMTPTERDGGGRTLYEQVWPRLAVISCWADAAAGDALPAVREHFPNVAVQRKGLVATEAFVSFPLTDELAALSLGSHFFEFESDADGRVRLAHELELGSTYSVVVTTGGGLYRYRLGDVVEVMGFENDCPLIRFLGRDDGVVDVRGEKLDDRFVRDCVRAVLEQQGLEAAFWLVAPTRTGSHGVSYALFIQARGQLAGVGAALDGELRRGFHYDYGRRLGQLGECRVFEIDSGADAHTLYLLRRAELGQRLGDVKPPAVDAFDRWSEVLPGRFV